MVGREGLLQAWMESEEEVVRRAYAAPERYWLPAHGTRHGNHITGPSRHTCLRTPFLIHSLSSTSKGCLQTAQYVVSTVVSSSTCFVSMLGESYGEMLAHVGSYICDQKCTFGESPEDSEFRLHRDAPTVYVPDRISRSRLSYILRTALLFHRIS